MEAGTLQCPQCGAAVSSDSTQCQFCHALLQTVACPKCMGMMFAGSKFCPHCGAMAQNVMQGPASSRHCPRCDLPLQDVQVANTPLEECTRCGGLWIDVSCFETICSNAQAQQAATGLQLPPPVEVNTAVRYLPCPQCKNLMNRMNYAGRSGIILNICRTHGIWLDRDEMRQVIAFIRAGGVDRARSAEIEELKESRRTAESINTVDMDGSSNDLFRHYTDADERVQLLHGIASLANHFLGGSILRF